jgi:hypothetical protein
MQALKKVTHKYQPHPKPFFGQKVQKPPSFFNAQSPSTIQSSTVPLKKEVLTNVVSQNEELLQKSPDTDPYYPSEAQQEDIEKKLKRTYKGTKATSPSKAPAPSKPGTSSTTPSAPAPSGSKSSQVPTQGRVLDLTQQKAMAKKLKAPFYSIIDEYTMHMPSPPIGKTKAYEMVKKAKDEIYKMFGSYISRNISLTQDQSISLAERRRKNQVLVLFKDMSKAGVPFARAVIDTDCKACETEFEGLSEDSKNKVINLMIIEALKERKKDLQKAALLGVGGLYTPDKDTISLPLKERGFFRSAVHELMHALTHPAFRAAFGDEPHVNDGFTEYFTRQIASGTSYQDSYSSVKSLTDILKGPFSIKYSGEASGEESLRQAYFKGRLDLIGWKPNSPKELEAVTAAGGSAAWDPATAKKHEMKYQAEAQAAQASKRNLIGTGIFISSVKTFDPTISVRYVRVLGETSPYSRGRLLLEGQVFGSPVEDPKMLGGSIGLAGEYQEPHFYVGGGLRVSGSATLAGDNRRIDLSPFVGIGYRAWQRVRIGAEGFVLVPLWEGGFSGGVGANVAVEF